jgi:membrane dipeptidase
MFTVGMVQRGISDTDIQKILGGNVMRVARAVFPPSG